MDTSVVLRAQDGDHEAFTELARSLYSRLHRIAQNILSGIAGVAVSAQGARATFEGNIILGSGGGISVEGGVPDVLGNRIEGVVGTGISVGTGTGGSVIGNELCDNGTDLEVAADATATVADNLACGD